jgi:pyruvate,orthophosphate dikinase
MDGLPITVRLLDPPLHEFLPHEDKEINGLAEALGKENKIVRLRVKELAESNPMLGHRGCRLAITYPEIYEMQARAIFEAIAELGKPVNIEIMIPLVLDKKELDFIRGIIDQQARDLLGAKQQKYKVGTMIELPRAALIAGEIAESAEFFSFGTNDLTQTTLGLSRDDAPKFIEEYIAKGILKVDPFAEIDVAGVGALINVACKCAMITRPDIKIGICGEHGGNPKSIEFFNSIEGLSYVSCSPYRIPIARLSAAHAALLQSDNKQILVKAAA